MSTGGCRLWDQHPVADEQAVWSGACIDGYADGAGRLLWNVPSSVLDQAGKVVVDRSVLVTSSTYEGGMRRGFEEGDGTLEIVVPGTGETRTTLRGRFVAGRLEGPGTMENARGVRYVGNFHLGMKDGQGTTLYPDGNRYDGEFRDGYWDGRGELRFAHGSSYVGEFRRGWPDGTGRAVVMAADDTDLAKRTGAGATGPLVLDGRWEHGCFMSATQHGCIRFGAVSGRS